jgi:uridylate kinase
LCHTENELPALFCVAVNAEVVLKATNVDGVYDSDPRKNANATLLNHVSYRDVALKNLSVMDITAITLCQENHIPGEKDPDCSNKLFVSI